METGSAKEIRICVAAEKARVLLTLREILGTGFSAPHAHWIGFPRTQTEPAFRRSGRRLGFPKNVHSPGAQTPSE
jgi:hypothetical protein